ncbi:MAG: indole-3-glycerol phosphate synthase TrpC [Rickettsiales bacterium]|nr:indole-3-glycerol phosphate synthase TrpC [Rickettsiales bacterium]
MSDTLAKICADKREHIARSKESVSLAELEARIASGQKPRGFRRALAQAIEQGHIALIAEIKKASPSVGVIRADFDPATLARAYQKGGAHCLSVLTDQPYFQGEDAYLQAARQAVSLPVLRKDFMLDPYQIIESRALGADCILLIMAALSDSQAAELENTAIELGMDVLVEVHDQDELDRALLHLRPQLLGVNNRNLKTLKVDLATSETLAKQIPSPILRVCESGIRTHDDIVRMQHANIHCFLVGESLMREEDVTLATKELLTGHI